MNSFVFEGKTINISYFDEQTFETVCESKDIEILSKKDLEYPWINTDFSKSALTAYEYISKKTEKVCYAYENSFGEVDTWSTVIYTCDVPISDVFGMLRVHDKLEEGNKDTIEHCIQCKRLYGLMVMLRPIAIKEWAEDGKVIRSEKYRCTCGCDFERTIVKGEVES